MKDKNESLLKTVLFFAKFSKKEISFLYPFGRQKHLNSTFCSHLILLEKGLEDALEPAEPRVSKTFLMGRMRGLEPPTPGITSRCSNQLSYIRHIA